MLLCSENAPKEITFSKEYLYGAKDDESSFSSTVKSLDADSDSSFEINVNVINDVINDAKTTTTLKRLCSISDIENRMKESFSYLSRSLWFIKEKETIAKIFRSVSSESEVDYYTVMLEALDEHRVK